MKHPEVHSRFDQMRDREIKIDQKYGFGGPLRSAENWVYVHENRAVLDPQLPGAKQDRAAHSV